MPIHPDAPLPTTNDARVAQDIADLRRELAALRAGGTPAKVGDGPPTVDPTTLAEGAEYLDRVNRRVYYVLAGIWRYAALT